MAESLLENRNLSQGTAYRRFVLFTCLLALVVVVLGAYTRLTDAGLGCPDWPGCYGRMIVPASEDEVLDKSYLEQRPLEPEKGWNEMVHRYFAGALGLAILVIAVWSWRRNGQPGQPLWLPLLLLALVIFQAILGMWTVTLQLKPVVVLAHLLGGMTTLALLVLLALRAPPGLLKRNAVVEVPPGWRALALLGLVVLVLQIALGGWTSSNYAALACPDFPTCQGRWWPEVDYQEAFVLWRGTDVNYEFGVLDSDARTAIHLTHRLGAVITLIVLGWLALRLVRGEHLATRVTGWLIGGLLVLQLGLGIANILYFLPLPVAVAHNGIAALLLLSLVLVNFQLWQRPH